MPNHHCFRQYLYPSKEHKSSIRFTQHIWVFFLVVNDTAMFYRSPFVNYVVLKPRHFFKIFNKIAIQVTPEMAVDKEDISLSRVGTYIHTILSVTCPYPMCNPS